MGQGTVKAGQTAYPEWLFPWLPSKYLNFIWGTFQHSDISFKIISDTVKLNSYKIYIATKFHLIALFVIILAK